MFHGIQDHNWRYHLLNFFTLWVLLTFFYTIIQGWKWLVEPNAIIGQGQLYLQNIKTNKLNFKNITL